MADYQVAPSHLPEFGGPLDFSGLDPSVLLPSGPTQLGGPTGDAASPDPSGSTDPVGGRMPLDLPPQPQSWGLQNPTIPNQLAGWLRNYYGGVGSLDEDMLAGLVRSARQGELADDPWLSAHGADFGHGNDGLPDGGANLPSYGIGDEPADGTLGGAGTGPARYGGSNDLSEPQPTWLGTLDLSKLGSPEPDGSSWSQAIGASYAP